MDDDLGEDSFDSALANIKIPSETKIAKLDTVSSENERSPNLPKVIAPPNPHCILVNPKQRGNPILGSIVNAPLEFREIVPDYIVGRTTCILYLSLKYHTLNPDYICQRLKALGKQYELRVLLVQVDTPVS